MKFNFLLILTGLIVGVATNCTSFSENRKVANSKADKVAIEKNLPLIYDISGLHIDSAGGVGLTVQIRNTSTKAIKYLRLALSPYNAVGDRVSSDIGNRTQALLSFTGPIPSIRGDTSQIIDLQEKNRGDFATIWYNHTITCVKVDHIEITYMDNSRSLIKAKTDLTTMNKIYSEALTSQEGLSDFDKKWSASIICPN